ncbi:hypothetical protein GGF32_000568 [Allomyces javanicus]|nr:hypothetical protein GGF32_000568 [Allomyces javanicus]
MLVDLPYDILHRIAHLRRCDIWSNRYTIPLRYWKDAATSLVWNSAFDSAEAVIAWVALFTNLPSTLKRLRLAYDGCGVIAVPVQSALVALLRRYSMLRTFQLEHFTQDGFDELFAALPRTGLRFLAFDLNDELFDGAELAHLVPEDLPQGLPKLLIHVGDQLLSLGYRRGA